MQKYLVDDSENNIILYNNLQSNSLVDGIDTLIEKYNRLYEFGLTMSGFQFVGLTLESGDLTLITQKVSYFLLAFCFLFSLFGSTICYIIVKYLTTNKLEEQEYILAGIYLFRKFLYFAEIVPYINSGLFLLSINLLVHGELDLAFAVVFNAVSFFLLVSGLVMVYTMNYKKQIYQPFDEQFIRLKDKTK